MSGAFLVPLAIFLPLVLSAAASFGRCLAQRNGRLMFVDGPLYGGIVAATVFGVFATWMWCFPSGGQGPSPVGMADPSVTGWAIITGVYAVVGAGIGLLAATTVLIARQLRLRGVGPSRVQ